MFSVSLELTYYVRSFVRLLYPAHCALCSTALWIDEVSICTVCTPQITMISEPNCVKCAKPMPPFTEHQHVCNSCKSDRPFFDRGYSLISYNEAAKTIFHQIKFDRRPWLLNIFNAKLKKFSENPILNDYDYVIPIPMESHREMDREFNQAALIAKMLVKTQKNLPNVRKLLVKKKKTEPQSLLPRFKRLVNLESAFQVKHPNLIQNKKILLVDDIFTTGSTMNECAKILKSAGAKQVDFFTLARA